MYKLVVNYKSGYKDGMHYLLLFGFPTFYYIYINLLFKIIFRLSSSQTLYRCINTSFYMIGLYRMSHDMSPTV